MVELTLQATKWCGLPLWPRSGWNRGEGGKLSCNIHTVFVLSVGPSSKAAAQGPRPSCFPTSLSPSPYLSVLVPGQCWRGPGLWFRGGGLFLDSSSSEEAAEETLPRECRKHKKPPPFPSPRSRLGSQGQLEEQVTKGRLSISLASGFPVGKVASPDWPGVAKRFKAL